MTIYLAYQKLLTKLYDVYDDREAANIADMLIEFVTGKRKIDRIMFKDLPVTDQQQNQLENYTDELLAHKPIQYVIGEVWFMGLKLKVNNQVLIPRPEAEELVDWVVNDIRRNEKENMSLIDIGTGSGCIPIAIKKCVNDLQVSAVDISEEALQLAVINSIEQQVLVDFIHLDFLNENEWRQLTKYDIVVSNPPYIRQSEKETMNKNVLNYEPHLALFVPNEDPLLFYEVLAKFGLQHLKENGALYMEINEALGDLVVQLFHENGYSQIQMKKDLQGKDRMIKAGR